MKDFHENEILEILVEKFTISHRWAYRIRNAAYKSFEEKDEKNLQKKIEFYKARKWRSLQEMDPAERKTAAGVGVMNKVINEIAVLDGLVTKRVEVKGDKENPINVQHAHAHAHIYRHEIDYSAIPTEVLEHFIMSARKNITLVGNT